MTKERKMPNPNLKYTRKWREKQRELGLCISCNREAGAGFSKCAYHLEVIRIESQHRANLFKANHVCMKCRGYNPKSTQICAACQAERTAKERGKRGRRDDD